MQRFQQEHAPGSPRPHSARPTEAKITLRVLTGRVLQVDPRGAEEKSAQHTLQHQGGADARIRQADGRQQSSAWSRPARAALPSPLRRSSKLGQRQQAEAAKPASRTREQHATPKTSRADCSRIGAAICTISSVPILRRKGTADAARMKAERAELGRPDRDQLVQMFGWLDPMTINSRAPYVTAMKVQPSSHARACGPARRASGQNAPMKIASAPILAIRYCVTHLDSGSKQLVPSLRYSIPGAKPDFTGSRAGGQYIGAVRHSLTRERNFRVSRSCRCIGTKRDVFRNHLTKISPRKSSA